MRYISKHRNLLIHRGFVFLASWRLQWPEPLAVVLKHSRARLPVRDCPGHIPTRMEDATIERLVVVHENFCIPQQVQLCLRKRRWRCWRDDFTISDVSGNKQWFKVRGTAFTGAQSTRKLLDAQGNVHARVKETPVPVPRLVFVRGLGFTFEVRPAALFRFLPSLENTTC